MIFIYFAESTGKMPKRIFQKDILKILGTVMIFGEGTHFIYVIISNIFNKLDKGSDDSVEIFGFNRELYNERFPAIIFFKDLRVENYFKDIFNKSVIKVRPELDKERKKKSKWYGPNNMRKLFFNAFLNGSGI